MNRTMPVTPHFSALQISLMLHAGLAAGQPESEAGAMLLDAFQDYIDFTGTPGTSDDGAGNAYIISPDGKQIHVCPARMAAEGDADTDGSGYDIPVEDRSGQRALMNQNDSFRDFFA